MDHWPDWGKRFEPGLFIIQPPAEVRSIVDAQRETYDPLSQSYVGAHITVTQPLIESPTESEWNQLAQVLGEFQPFEIHYGPLKSFLPYPCIFYEIQPAGRILEIRSALHQTGLFNLQEGYIENFTPHMTITEGQSGPEVTYELLDQLQGESRSGSFFCHELIFSAPDAGFNFRSRNVLQLGDSNWM